LVLRAAGREGLLDDLDEDANILRRIEELAAAALRPLATSRTIALPRGECNDVRHVGGVERRHCGLRILVTPTGSPSDLVDYLRRCGCDARISGNNVVEASPRLDVSPAHARLELDAYLHVWRAMHPTRGAEIVAPAPVDITAAARSGGVPSDGLP
jgi:hypothetical protein